MQLASLAKQGDLVEPDLSHPAVSAAAAEARSTSLPIVQCYDTNGERVMSEASGWRTLVHQLMLIASQIAAFQSLVPDLPLPERQQATNAAGAYIGKFRNLAFSDPDGPFPNLDGMNAELGQLFKEYAPHITPEEIPTAGLTPPPPPPTEPPPAGRRVASSVGIARLVLVTLGVAAVATVFVTVGMGETFGTPLNYLALAATAFGGGAGAQAMLDIVPFARRG
jgi:hypothetical protein